MAGLKIKLLNFLVGSKNLLVYIYIYGKHIQNITRNMSSCNIMILSYWYM